MSRRKHQGAVAEAQRRKLVHRFVDPERGMGDLNSECVCFFDGVVLFGVNCCLRLSIGIGEHNSVCCFLVFSIFSVFSLSFL